MVMTKTGLSSIFMKSRDHLNKLDWLTPQDLYYIYHLKLIMDQKLKSDIWLFSALPKFMIFPFSPLCEYLISNEPGSNGMVCLSSAYFPGAPINYNYCCTSGTHGGIPQCV